MLWQVVEEGIKKLRESDMLEWIYGYTTLDGKTYHMTVFCVRDGETFHLSNQKEILCEERHQHHYVDCSL